MNAEWQRSRRVSSRLLLGEKNTDMTSSIWQYKSKNVQLYNILHMYNIAWLSGIAVKSAGLNINKIGSRLYRAVE